MDIYTARHPGRDCRDPDHRDVIMRIENNLKDDFVWIKTVD